jgi:hypothetical protein
MATLFDTGIYTHITWQRHTYHRGTSRLKHQSLFQEFWHDGRGNAAWPSLSCSAARYHEYHESQELSDPTSLRHWPTWGWPNVHFFKEDKGCDFWQCWVLWQMRLPSARHCALLLQLWPQPWWVCIYVWMQWRDMILHSGLGLWDIDTSCSQLPLESTTSKPVCVARSLMKLRATNTPSPSSFILTCSHSTQCAFLTFHSFA